jgi:hypothetical protein
MAVQRAAMQINKKYSILVNSSDGFEDCWAPFFTLLQRYWPACDAKIYLNTEKKTCHYQGLPVTSTKVQGDAEARLSWSECLLRALDQIETPLVLYFQEDYFIHQPVRDDVIRRATEYMIVHQEVGHVALTRHCSLGPYEEHEEGWLQVIMKNARYRISTQAALWRVDTLRSYLEAKENGWMFEIYGTWRAHKRDDIFLSTRWDDALGGPAIDYLHTGIIKGKWLREIAAVFEKNEISVNYDKRGFYEPKSRLLHRIEVAQKLLQDPKYLLKQFFY